MLQIQRVLLPVDFSARCLRMTVYAKALAATYGSELTLFHVVNPMYSFPATAISGPAMVPMPNAMIAEREKQLEQFAADELRGVPVRRVVYEGDPAEQIAGFVKSEDIQLVIMPTHGYGVMRRFLIGSVTAKVLHDAVCPVLTGVHLDPHHDGSPRFSNVLCAIDLKPHNQATLEWAYQFAADVGAEFAIVSAVPNADQISQAREDLQTIDTSVGALRAPIHIEVGVAADTVCSTAKAHGADLLIIGRGARDESSGTLTSTAYAIIRQSPCPVISV